MLCVDSQPRPGPTHALWEFTSACNFRCIHCGGGSGKRRPDELNTEEALAVCRSLASIRCRAVTLMGGEVLLRKDWSVIAKYLTELGIPTGIFTNGHLLHDKILQTVSNCDIWEIGTSLDAIDPLVHDGIRGVKGAHECAIRTIKTMQLLPLRSRTVITSVHRDNIDQVEGIGEWLAENAPGINWGVNVSTWHRGTRMTRDRMIGCKEYRCLAQTLVEARQRFGERINALGAHEFGYHTTRLGPFRNQPWTGCEAGLNALGITSTGQIKGCLALPDEFIEGNVRERPLDEVWWDSAAFPYNRQFTVEQLGQNCAGCTYGDRCRGGCGDFSFAFTGRLHNHPFCLRRFEKNKQ